MGKAKKHNQSHRHQRAEGEWALSEKDGWAAERASQSARLQAMSTRTKASRTQVSVGQANLMRLKKGNQPRGGGGRQS